MLSQRMVRALGIGITGFAGAMLVGITKVFDLEPTTNLFQTGITPSLILGFGLLLIAFWIYKNRV